MHNILLKHKSKRVQKKLYLGDFAILGFEVSAQFESQDEEKVNLFFENFLDFTESMNLGFGGGYTIKEFDGFITAMGRYHSPSEDNRLAVEKWLCSQPNLVNIKLGGLIDANYGV